MTQENFTLQLGLNDFESLHNTSMQSFYSEQADRFEWINSDQFGKDYHDAIDLKTECIATNPKYPKNKSDVGWYMYWVGENALNAITAEKILQAAGYTVYRLWDLAEPYEWCLLSNYQSPAWKDMPRTLGDIPGPTDAEKKAALDACIAEGAAQ